MEDINGKMVKFMKVSGLMDLSTDLEFGEVLKVILT